MSKVHIDVPLVNVSINDTVVDIIGEHHSDDRFEELITDQLELSQYDGICVETCKERYSTTEVKSTNSIEIASNFADSSDIPLYLIDMPQSQLISNISFWYDESVEKLKFPTEDVIVNTDSTNVEVDYHKLLEHQVKVSNNYPEYWKLFWEKRTQYMANNIEGITRKHDLDRVLVIVGLSHQQLLRVELFDREHEYTEQEWNIDQIEMIPSS